MKETVLVVDDDERVRKCSRRALERAGFEVAEASEGVEALEALRLTPFRLVLLDVNMPGLNGPATFKQLREDHPSLPVLFVTSDKRRLNGILGQPRVGLVEKPFNNQQLVAAARELLT